DSGTGHRIGGTQSPPLPPAAACPAAAGASVPPATLTASNPLSTSRFSVFFMSDLLSGRSGDSSLWDGAPAGPPSTSPHDTRQRLATLAEGSPHRRGGRCWRPARYSGGPRRRSSSGSPRERCQPRTAPATHQSG